MGNTGQQSRARLDVNEVLGQDRMMPSGTYYQATVPDTLDLAERARLSVNVLTGNVDEEDLYHVFQTFRFDPGQPAEAGRGAKTLNITVKNARALPWMRTMCGSDLRLDRDYGMLKVLLSNVDEDGLMYFPVTRWAVPEGTADVTVCGTVGLACESHYALDGHPAWLEWIRLIASGLRKAAIHVEDRAYYPPECGVDRDGNWVRDLTGAAFLPYNPPDEPYLDQQGREGAVKYIQANPLRTLVQDYRHNGEEASLDLAGKILKFILKPGMWENTTLEGYKGNEHAIFSGHFHANLGTLLALLDLAEATQDQWLKQFVREGYENTQRHGAARLGWFPPYLTPAKFERPAYLAGHTETCAIAEIVELAVRLSDAGMGDYWDDVDAILRNHLSESQHADIDTITVVQDKV